MNPLNDTVMIALEAHAAYVIFAGRNLITLLRFRAPLANASRERGWSWVLASL